MIGVIFRHNNLVDTTVICDYYPKIMKSFKSILAKATIRMLRPVIHILMRNEISCSEFVEMAKQAYVDVAYERFAIPNRKTTYSRVSVLTGLSRKEVMRLSGQEEKDVPFVKGKVNRTSRVIAGWLKDKDFLDADNQPLDLPLKGEAGFEALVSRYGGDVTMVSMLDELKRLEAIEVLDDKKIRLVSYTYIPQKDHTEKVEIFAMCATDFLETGLHNIDHSGEEANFQRQVVYRAIPESVAKEFKEYSKKKSLDLLLDYSRWLNENQNRSSVKEGEAVKRIGAGIYHFEN